MNRKSSTSFPPGKRLPKGVEAAFVGSDGVETYVSNPLLSKVQWPGIAVDSTSFEQLSASEKLFVQAVAFLHAAKVLCKEAGLAGKAGKRISWSQGSVCFYCLNLATELYLKACISRVSERTAPGTHDLSKLLRRYEELLPRSEFHFQLPILWRSATSEIKVALGRPLFTPIDKTPDQFYRYGVTKDGLGSALVHRFIPGIMFNRIMRFEKVWRRTWGEVGKSRVKRKVSGTV